MPKISQLSALTTPDSGDELPIVDVSASTTKKITRANLLAGAPLPADTVDTQAIDDGAVTAPKTNFGGDYSTSEVNTGFKWVDGRDIYKKTISFGALPNNTTKNVAHGITNLDLIISYDGMAKVTSSGNQIPLPFVNNVLSTMPNYVYLGFTLTDITITTGIDRTGLTAYLTLYYIKT